MDDRKSTTSSFFGRKSSMDALNTAGNNDNDNDDSNSFYRNQRPSAGYNRNSFFQVGREEPLKDEQISPGGLKGDEGWDVCADFNNAGPRYSTAFGTTSGYQPITPGSGAGGDEEGQNKTEMVTVPVHGAEWTKTELRDMTKAGKRERKMDDRRNMWKSFTRRDGCFGITWVSRKTLVISIFVLCIIIGVIIGFTFPRVPSFGIDSKSPLKSAAGTDFNDTIPISFERAPAATFNFPAFAHLQVNTQSSYVPLTFNHLYAEVTDLETFRKVATGDLGHYKLPAKSFPVILLPLNFTYAANNETDQTWANFYNACKNKIQFPDGQRPGLAFKLTLTMDIAGYPGSPQTSSQVTNAACPFELPNNI